MPRPFMNFCYLQEPKIETLTKETVQTFRGNKIERKVTSQKKDSQNVHSDLINRIDLITINGKYKVVNPI